MKLHSLISTEALLVVNGELIMPSADLPEGLLVCDLQSAFVTHPDKVKKVMAKFEDTRNLENGLFIFIPDDLVINRPLLIHYHANNPPREANVIRNLIYCGKRSQVTVLEYFSGEGDIAYSHNRVTQLELDEHSQLNHIHLQNEEDSAAHVSEIFVEQSAHSSYHSTSFSTGAQSQQQTWTINLIGEEARCLCRGMSIVNKAQQSNYHVTIHHEARTCFSDQQFKAIADEKARAKYTGKVVVQSTGLQTTAHQQSSNLLLSSNAEIVTCPELEIYTDEVKCSHGASVGELDSDQLFYLQSRGIPMDHAKEILLQAFVHDHLDSVSPDIQSVITPIIANKLSQMSGGKSQ